MMVTSDGSVKPCCYAARSVGNLNVQTPEDVWNGPIMQELRSYIKQDRLHRICEGSPCKFVVNHLGKQGKDIGTPA